VPRVAIGLGSNVGDREGHLASAVSELRALGTLVAVAPLFETAPVGGPAQASFLNGAVLLETPRPPRELLGGLLAIEDRHGRRRDERWGPRPLDLDLLLYGDEALVEPGLEVPHPRMRSRRFVLEPLAALDPGARLPDGAAVMGLLEAVADQEVRPVTGGYDLAAGRWMTSLVAATEVIPDGDGFRARAGSDWENTLGSVFGGVPMGMALRAAAAVAPGLRPLTLSYGFLGPIRSEDPVRIAVTVLRRATRSATVRAVLSTGERTVGVGRVRLVVGDAAPERARPAPAAPPPGACRSRPRLLEELQVPVSAAIRNWTMWEPEDPVDHEGRALAWSPAPVVAPEDPVLAALATLPALDALAWRTVTPFDGRAVMPATPTMEIAVSFHHLASRSGWHRTEARLVATGGGYGTGTVGVWDAPGRLLGSALVTMAVMPRRDAEGRRGV